MNTRIYDWPAWLSAPQEDGVCRTLLVRGVDYQTSQATMSQIIRNAACKLHLVVRVVDLDDRLFVATRARRAA